MICIPITYTDYNGIERKEEYNFNLSRAEINDMQYSTPAGIVAKLNAMLAANDHQAMYKFFRDFILRAYGVKSDDGRRFIKSDELATAFSQTEAFSELFAYLTSGEDAKDHIIEFVRGVMPKPKETAPAVHPAAQ